MSANPWLKYRPTASSRPAPPLPAGIPAPVPVAPVLAVTEPLPSQSDEREAFEERAAIMEYDGGLTRQDAEQKAAAAHRQAMPHVAHAVDAIRAIFGPAVRVVYAAEGGRELKTKENS